MNKLKQVRGVDFHCHVDLYPNPIEMIAACDSARIVTLAVTTTPKAWFQNQRWTKLSRYVFPALGLHPELVSNRHREIALLEEHIEMSRFVGEVGLDGRPQFRKSWQLQAEVFVRALSAAERYGGRVISIHCRRAAGEVVRCIESHTTSGNVLAILHWFSGSETVGCRATELGCYFSINHQTLESERGLNLVRSLPEDRLLTETDGPLTHMGNRKSEPHDVLVTMERLADARGISVATMRDVLTENARRVLRFANVRLHGDESET